MRTVFRNGTVITPYRVLEESSVVIEEGRIQYIAPDSEVDLDLSCTEVIDVGGRYIAPGFIDIHCHGGGDYDFMDGTVEAFIQASNAHLRYGTTSMLPTTTTSTTEELFKAIDSFKLARDMERGPNLLGLHVEGPYLAYEQRGAQDPRYIKEPSPEEYNAILDYSDVIKRWTIAPELPGAMEMAQLLRERGIVCSIGHSDAFFDDVVRAVESGFTHVTHLYSAMSMVRRINAYRHAGVVESALLLDDLTVELIADGAHLPQSLLQLVYKVKGPDKICLVTDSIRAATMPEGVTTLGSKEDGQVVIVEDGVAKLPDRSAFAGST
ncbi:MAG: N-acetylglucosamine-6-phosphate deacetylase, partial [Firmicutes bacterium]|nr:N-acetylglucosamine-6-phosphate deacetylase [Bacillota bacterium]